MVVDKSTFAYDLHFGWNLKVEISETSFKHQKGENSTVIKTNASLFSLKIHCVILFSESRDFLQAPLQCLYADKISDSFSWSAVIMLCSLHFCSWPIPFSLLSSFTPAPEFTNPLECTSGSNRIVYLIIKAFEYKWLNHKVVSFGMVK